MPLPNYPYNDNIPNAPNSPSVDQPNMQINTNSIRSLIKEDHVDFGTNGSGLHNKVRLIQQAALPAGLQSGMGTLYVKSATSTTGNNESSLFYTPGGSGSEYRMTRSIQAQFPKFGTNNVYTWGGQPAGTTANGGWTFLPGGLLMMYGTFTKVGGINTSGTINFPFAFTAAPYNVTISNSKKNNGNPSHSVSGGVSNFTTTSFDYSYFEANGPVPSEGPVNIYCIAIGI